jgi:hypothetical protein
MSTLIRSALIAVVLATATAATAAPHFSDNRDPNGGYDPNSPQGVRAWLDYRQQHGN